MNVPDSAPAAHSRERITSESSTRLVAAGWRRTPSGRWIHPDAPPLTTARRRLFTEAEALTLLGADEPTDECCENETQEQHA